MKFVKDDKVFANFQRLGIRLEARKVPLSKIDLNEGLRRQTRLIGKLKDDIVLQYADSMLQPDAAFPMVVLCENKLFWPISGNHRLASYVLAKSDARAADWPDEIDAYVCPYSTFTKDLMLLDIVTRVVNSWETAIGVSTEEKIAHARWLIEKYSMKASEAAALFGLKDSHIYKANASANVKQELTLAGINTNGFSKTLLEKMNPLTENRNVLRATAKLLHSYNVSGDEALHVIGDVRQHKTELQMVSELGRWEKLLEARRAPVKAKEKEVKATKTVVTFTTAKRDAFVRNLTGLDKVLSTADTLDKLQITDPADMANAERTWKRIRKVMDAIMGGK